MEADLRWAMSTPWVAARLGLDPLKVERLRRAGELLAVRPAGSADWLFPSWQFETSGGVRPAVAALLRTARERGIPAARLHEVLTRRSWVSHDDTQIVSNGACITALGPGPVRLTSSDGDPIAADAVFFVNHSRPLDATPVRVTIHGLRVVVPRAADMFGIGIFAHE